ncbi:MAG: sulfatase-like hydrolase/transferase [Candidatus Glassbacteria bacterium]
MPANGLSINKHLRRSASLGFLVGATTAFVEITVLLIASGPMAIINPRFYFPSMVIYGIVWSVAGFLLGLVTALLARLSGRIGFGDEWRLTAFYLTIISCGTLFLIGGGYVNSKLFPSYLDIQSLVFDAIFFAFVYILWRYIYRLLRESGGGLKRTLKVWKYAVALCLIASVIISLSRAGTGNPAARGIPSPSMPNVLVLLIDTLRADHLSCYGYERKTSPNIDKLAEEGALFLNAYSQASWTKPATASLMTGYFPSTHQTTTMGSGLMESFRILPEVYRDKGYRTAILTSNNLVSPLFGFDQGVDLFYYGKAQMVRELMLGNIIRTLLRGNQDRKRKVEDYFWKLEAILRFRERVDYDSSVDSLNGRFLEWVDEDSARPFFAYIHYIEPHFPYTPPPPYDTRFTSILPGAYVQPTHNYGFQPFDRMESVERELIETVVGEYDGEIAYLDNRLGAFFYELGERELLDGTIILLTSDHGEEFFEHSMWGHGHSLFNEVVRIPMLIRYPQAIEAGTRITAISSLVDVMPTLLDLSGIDDEIESAGRSLVPALREGDRGPVSFDAYGEVLKGGRRAWFYTDGRYKLLKYEKGLLKKTLLFDLSSDSDENRDISDSLINLRDSLLAKMEAIHRSSSSKAVEGESRKIDKATEDQLKALGYIY